MEKDLEFQKERRTLWSKVAVAYVQSSNSTTKKYASEWADQILKDFDERFAEKIKSEER